MNAASGRRGARRKSRRREHRDAREGDARVVERGAPHGSTARGRRTRGDRTRPRRSRTTTKNAPRRGEIGRRRRVPRGGADPAFGATSAPRRASPPLPSPLPIRRCAGGGLGPPKARRYQRDDIKTHSRGCFSTPRAILHRGEISATAAAVCRCDWACHAADRSNPRDDRLPVVQISISAAGDGRALLKRVHSRRRHRRAHRTCHSAGARAFRPRGPDGGVRRVLRALPRGARAFLRPIPRERLPRRLLARPPRACVPAQPDLSPRW